MQRRQFMHASLASAGALAMGWQGLARAQTNTISFIMPMGGGTGGDTSTRVLAEEIGLRLKKTILVENKPGADTMIATNHVLSGPADGSRVLFTSPSAMVLLPLINKQSDFNPQKQLEPVITALRGGAAVMVGPSGYKGIDELIAAAKNQPGKISLATYGGHYYKLLALMIEREFGVQFNKVPYKDPAPAMNDVAGGNVHAMLIDAGGAREWHNAKKARVIALTHDTRPEAFKEVPTFKEKGHPNLVSYIWTGFAVKAGTPPELVQAYYKAISDSLKSKSYQEYMARSNSGAEVVDYDPQRTRQYLDAERKRFATLIEQTGYTS